MRPPSRSTLVIAHRGASGHAPENTLAAVAQAIALGADMAEIDVQLTKDEELVVLHDRVLARTIRSAELSARQLRRLAVGDLTVPELRQLDAGAWWGPTFVGEPLPSLHEVLALCAGRLVVNIELKPKANSLREREALCLALSHTLAVHARADVLISSFDHAVLRALADTRGCPPLGILATRRGVARALTVAAQTKAVSVHVPAASVTPALVQTVHAAGRRLFAYTANDVPLLTRLVSIGVDGIFTDFPERLIAVLEHT